MTAQDGDGTRARRVGRLAGITRFAVKAVDGEPLQRAEIRADGLAHDRRYAVLGEDGYYLSHEDAPELGLVRSRMRGDRLEVELPDGGPLPLSRELDHALTRLVGRPVRLRKVDLGTTHGPETLPTIAEHLGLPPGSPGLDADALAHLHVLTDTAVATMRAAHAGEPPRFRSTFLLELEDPAGTGTVPENGWLHRDVSIGDVVVTLYGPTVNCCRAHSPTGSGHTNAYGVHALVRRPGTVGIEDPVVLR